MENYYEILEIKKNATKGEIKSSYIKLLRNYPPEKDQEKFSKSSKKIFIALSFSPLYERANPNLFFI